MVGSAASPRRARRLFLSSATPARTPSTSPSTRNRSTVPSPTSSRWGWRPNRRVILDRAQGSPARTCGFRRLRSRPTRRRRSSARPASAPARTYPGAFSTSRSASTSPTFPIAARGRRCRLSSAGTSTICAPPSRPALRRSVGHVKGIAVMARAAGADGPRCRDHRRAGPARGRGERVERVLLPEGHPEPIVRNAKRR